MKAVDFGQKFISFSFVIEDDKRVVSISEVCWRLLFGEMTNSDKTPSKCKCCFVRSSSVIYKFVKSP